MPEAAVDENGEATSGESEVGSPGQIDLPSPARKSALPEESDDNGLCGFVAAASN